jgi:hypothetical protein
VLYGVSSYLETDEERNHTRTHPCNLIHSTGLFMAKSTFPRLEVALIVLGLFLLAWSAGYGALLLFGRQATGTIEYSVRNYGMSRGVSYRVHYQFLASDDQLHRGTMTLHRNSVPLGVIRVHYLAFWPNIHSAGGTGALRFNACITALPGILLTALGSRLLQLQRRTAARRKRN